MSPLDERWDRLSAGTLGADEHDELLGLADASGEGYEAYQAFKPLGPAFRQNVAAAILDRQRQEREAAREAHEAAAAKTTPQTAAEAPRPERRGFLRWAGGFAAAAMMAAAIFFYPPQRMGFRIEVSPALAAGGLRSGAQAAPNGPAVLQPGGDLDALARAERAGSVDVEVHFYLYQDLQLLPLGEASRQGGNYRLTGAVPALPGFRSGDATLAFVSASPGKLPDPATLRAALAAGEAEPRDRSWRFDSAPVRLELGG